LRQLRLPWFVGAAGSAFSPSAAIHPALQRRYWNGLLWSPSYFAASCGGAPIISIIGQWIERQRTPDEIHVGADAPKFPDQAFR
jgi:REP element-mobilizing transposase RayT